MLRISAIFFNLFLIAFTVFILITQGLPNRDEEVIMLVVFVITLTINLTYIFRTGRPEDSIISLWIESKKKKLRREIDDLDKKD